MEESTVCSTDASVDRICMKFYSNSSILGWFRYNGTAAGEDLSLLGRRGVVPHMPRRTGEGRRSCPRGRRRLPSRDSDLAPTAPYLLPVRPYWASPLTNRSIARRANSSSPTCSSSRRRGCVIGDDELDRFYGIPGV